MAMRCSVFFHILSTAIAALSESSMKMASEQNQTRTGPFTSHEYLLMSSSGAGIQGVAK